MSLPSCQSAVQRRLGKHGFTNPHMGASTALGDWTPACCEELVDRYDNFELATDNSKLTAPAPIHFTSFHRNDLDVAVAAQKSNADIVWMALEQQVDAAFRHPEISDPDPLDAVG